MRQVSASLSGEWQRIEILRAGGEHYSDIRPLVRLNVSVVVEENGRQESGSFGGGGRSGYETYLDPDYWQGAIDEALRQALVNLTSIPAPAGEMTVVLGPGWPGILLHEAIGHGLEGDFNRKKTSAFAGLLGERVAAPGVTVVDDGTMDGRRGSLSIDDEGTPTHRTVLIEDGILKGYMQDRQNARLMGVAATGNGRRQSYASPVMPRMTNTYMLGGDKDPAEILASVKKGIYATNFGGGQVDITNGKFVFSCTEAYSIEDGKLGHAIKGATLIGSGPESLTRVSMIGNDMKLDTGIGTCGKNGQSVPVGVGQPTLRLDGLTVGGTAGCLMPHYWFRQKKFGYGATPNTWQGWTLTIVSSLAVFGVILSAPMIRDNCCAWRGSCWAWPSILVPVTFIAYRQKTEGGWRWRNGRDD